MDHKKIAQDLQSVLGIKKEPVAIKAWKSPPAHIPEYAGGNAFPGLCTMIAEVLGGAPTFYADQQHCFCTGGMLAVGTVEPISEEDQREIIDVHLSISQGYRDVDTAIRYEKAKARSIPDSPVKNAVVQVGLLRDVPEPDVVLVFCTPRQADMLSRAYCYEAGEPITGFGGNGGCSFLIQYPYATKKPSFSNGDVAWRKYVGLTDDELTMGFPLESLGLFMPELARHAGAYRSYGEPQE